MKRLILLVLCAAAAVISAYAGGKKNEGAKVDERVELMNVVFRLAGAQEYSFKYAKQYTEDMEQWFGPYREDTLVRYVKRLRGSLGTGYDAVASMAISLQGKGGAYRLPENAKALEELYEGTDDTGRWNRWNAPVFVKMLNDFYKKTDFAGFFKSHKKWYEAMEKRFNENIGFNRSWYAGFYGEPSDSEYRIIIGCANGPGNYGPRTYDEKGNKTAYAVMGCWSFGDDGIAVFGKDSGHAGVLIHEFNHSFVNPMLEAANAGVRLKDAGDKIMKYVGKEMAAQAYPGFETVLKESVVRAAVVRYMRDNGYTQDEIDTEIAQQRALSFLWIEGLDSLLGVYSAQRDKYPVFHDFYPRIEEFFNDVAENIESMHEEFLRKQPRVVALSPDINGRDDVDPATAELKISFSRPLFTDVKGAVGVQIRAGDKDAITGAKETGSDFKTYKLNLKPGTYYSFRVMGFVPATEYGYYVRRYDIQFTTAK